METVFIYLANLVEYGMPYYTNLKWDYYTTQEIINIIKKSPDLYYDYSKIDCNILAEEFEKLRQE